MGTVVQVVEPIKYQTLEDNTNNNFEFQKNIKVDDILLFTTGFAIWVTGCVYIFDTDDNKPVLSCSVNKQLTSDYSIVVK